MDATVLVMLNTLNTSYALLAARVALLEAKLETIEETADEDRHDFMRELDALEERLDPMTS